MFEAEATFRRLENGGIAFLPNDAEDSAFDGFCDLKVSFSVTDIYPPEPDVGAGLDWSGDIDRIQMRTPEFHAWRMLHGEEKEVARVFLLRHHGEALWDAGGEYAERLYFREAG